MALQKYLLDPKTLAYVSRFAYCQLAWHGGILDPEAKGKVKAFIEKYDTLKDKDRGPVYGKGY